MQVPLARRSQGSRESLRVAGGHSDGASVGSEGDLPSWRLDPNGAVACGVFAVVHCKRVPQEALRVNAQSLADEALMSCRRALAVATVMQPLVSGTLPVTVLQLLSRVDRPVWHTVAGACARAR